MGGFDNPEIFNFKVYVLALEGGKFYVGITKEVDRRLAEHKSGQGARFSKRNKPLGIVYTKTLNTAFFKDAEIEEDKITIDLMKKYGIENVQGGHYCQFSTTNRIKAMGQDLYEEVMSAQGSSKALKSYSVIDTNL